MLKVPTIIALIICALIDLPAYSEIITKDVEFMESAKCSKYFPYFEKKYQLPLETLHSISLRESGKQHSIYNIKIVWPWTVNIGGKGYYFNNKSKALDFVKKQIIDGKTNIDVGCMQINLNHHLEAFKTLEDAFDPKLNIKYAAEFVRAKYNIYHSWDAAIANYHSATHSRGFKYKEDVMAIANKMNGYKFNLNELVLTQIKNDQRAEIVEKNLNAAGPNRNVSRDEKFYNKIKRPAHTLKDGNGELSLSPHLHFENDINPSIKIQP